MVQTCYKRDVSATQLLLEHVYYCGWIRRNRGRGRIAVVHSEADEIMLLSNGWAIYWLRSE